MVVESDVWGAGRCECGGSGGLVMILLLLVSAASSSFLLLLLLVLILLSGGYDRRIWLRCVAWSALKEKNQ